MRSFCGLARLGTRSVLGTLLILIGTQACGELPADRGGEATLDAQERPPARPGRLPAEGSEIDQSRATAIVRAASRVAPSVVTIHVQRTQRVRSRSFFDSFFAPSRERVIAGLGSGFVIDDQGHVITNDHVVQGAQRIMVTLADGRDLDAALVGTDEVTDIAVLRVDDAGGTPLARAPLGESGDLLIGEWAIAIGNPFGNLLSNTEPSVTAGVISALGRHIVPDGTDRGFYLGMIQTDASINPGNSGGPLVNALGEVVGVNASIFSRSGGSEGLGFAIPIDRALRVARDLIDDGQIRRAWLGIDVDEAEADEWGRRRGVLASQVSGSSPAAEAGIRAGRMLLALNGRPLTNPLDFQSGLLDLRAGDTAELLVEGRSEPVLLRATDLPSLTAERVTVLQELELVTLTAAIQAERRTASSVGALVVGISDALSRALGITEGDVILRINRAPIRAAEEARQVLLSLQERGGRVRIEFESNGAYNMREFVWR